jgi:hypothetical protein
MRKAITETQYKVKTIHFTLVLAWESSLVTQWIMGEISNTYTVTWSQIQLASSVMVLEGGKEEDSTACGGGENYHVVGEHMCIANLFLNSCKNDYIIFEIQAGWIRIPCSWIQITGSSV